MLEKLFCFLNMHKWSNNIDIKLISGWKFGKKVTIVRYKYHCKYCKQVKETDRELY